MHCCAGDSALSTNMVHTDLLYCGFSFLMWSQLNILIVDVTTSCSFVDWHTGTVTAMYFIIIIMHVQT